MLEMILGVLGVTVLFAAWIGVQSFQRRHSTEMANDADVLACTMCDPTRACSCGLRTVKERSVSGVKE